MTDLESDADDALARQFLESIRIGNEGGPAADAIDDLVIGAPERAWNIAVTATRIAESPLELECVGAFILEELLGRYPDRFVQSVVGAITESAAFTKAAASASMSGLPRHVWERINEALRSAGVAERQLIDWSTIQPPAPESS